MKITTSKANEIIRVLKSHIDKKRGENFRKFFKNNHDDIFWGIPVNTIKKIARNYLEIKLADIKEMMKSRVHDTRSTANAILCMKFKKCNEKEQARIFNFYIRNKHLLRDWDSVDDTAPYIMGPWLIHREKDILYNLARSNRIWDRRIAMVTTLHFIRHEKLVDTYKLARILLHDKEELVHKAVGWTLREAGKKNHGQLKKFLEKIMDQCHAQC